MGYPLRLFVCMDYSTAHGLYTMILLGTIHRFRHDMAARHGERDNRKTSRYLQQLKIPFTLQFDQRKIMYVLTSSCSFLIQNYLNKLYLYVLKWCLETQLRKPLYCVRGEARKNMLPWVHIRSEDFVSFFYLEKQRSIVHAKVLSICLSFPSTLRYALC